MMTLIINGLILTLLVGAIGYIYLVDLRVRRLLAALREMEPMVGAFSSAVDRSETSLEKLKSTKVADIGGEKSENDRRTKEATPSKPHVGLVSLPAKSELVRSFFETARGQET